MKKEIKDIRFNLRAFFDNLQTTASKYRSLYMSYQRQIIDHGYYQFTYITDEGDYVCKVYTPELAVIFDFREFITQNFETKENLIINGFDYFDTYIQGFKEGAEYFKENYDVPPGIRYDEKFLSDLYILYNATGYNGYEGWKIIKHRYNTIITHKDIKNYGYFAGIVSEYEELEKKYPVSFMNIKNKFSIEPYEQLKNFPTLPECFKDKIDFDTYILKTPQITEYFDIYKDGSYHWKSGKKIYLAGLAHKLLNTGKLIDNIKTYQDLARIFCPFFHVKFNSKQDKQFEPGRAKDEYFLFIK